MIQLKLRAWHAVHPRFQCPKRFIALLHCSMSKINKVEPSCCVALNEMILGQYAPIYRTV